MPVDLVTGFLLATAVSRLAAESKAKLNHT